MSINSIEKAVGLGIGSMCKWNVVSPTVRNLKAVAMVLDTTIDELVT